MILDPERPLKLSVLERGTSPGPPDWSVKGLESEERAGDCDGSLHAPDAHSGYGVLQKGPVPLAWSSAAGAVDRQPEDLIVSLPPAVPEWGFVSILFFLSIAKEESSLDLVLVSTVKS